LPAQFKIPRPPLSSSSTHALHICFYSVLISDVNNNKKTKQLLGSKNQGKKLAKTRNLCFLRNVCAQGGGESRKPTKTREKFKVAENQKFWLDFCTKKDCASVHTPSVL
jgi:hypothetical protein